MSFLLVNSVRLIHKIKKIDKSVAMAIFSQFPHFPRPFFAYQNNQQQENLNLVQVPL